MTSFRDWLQNKLLGYKEEEDYNMLTAGTRDAILAELSKRLGNPEKNLKRKFDNSWTDGYIIGVISESKRIRKVLLG